MIVHERLIRRAAMVAMAAASITACNGSSVQQAASAGHVLTGIQISPSAPDALALPVGHDLQLTATGTFSDGATADVTALVTWGSSDGSIATVSSGGVVSAAAVGSAAITASDPGSGISASVSVSVLGADLVLLSISPIDPTILVGTSLQLSADGLLSDDSIADYTGSVWWSSSDESIATVSSHGLFSAVALGSATITATDPVSGMSDSVVASGTDVPAALSFLSVSRGSVIGGGSVEVTGTVYLTSFTVDPIEISLASTDPSAASVPASVVIPAGAASASFPVTTYVVPHRSHLFITATDGTVTKKARMNIRTAPH